MAYTSTYTGSHNDAYNNRIATLEKSIITLSNVLNQQLNDITNLQSIITNNTNIIAAKAYYKGTIDGQQQLITVSDSSYLAFNQIVFDTGNNFDTTSGKFTVPTDGLYLVILTINNQTNFSVVFANAQLAITHVNSSNTILNRIIGRTVPSGISMSNIFQANTGDKFYAEVISNQTYTRIGKNFNEFTIYRLS